MPRVSPPTRSPSANAERICTMARSTSPSVRVRRTTSPVTTSIGARAGVDHHQHAAVGGDGRAVEPLGEGARRRRWARPDEDRELEAADCSAARIALSIAYRSPSETAHQLPLPPPVVLGLSASASASCRPRARRSGAVRRTTGRGVSAAGRHVLAAGQRRARRRPARSAARAPSGIADDHQQQRTAARPRRGRSSPPGPRRRPARRRAAGAARRRARARCDGSASRISEVVTGQQDNQAPGRSGGWSPADILGRHVPTRHGRPLYDRRDGLQHVLDATGSERAAWFADVLIGKPLALLGAAPARPGGALDPAPPGRPAGEPRRDRRAPRPGLTGSRSARSARAGSASSQDLAVATRRVQRAKTMGSLLKSIVTGVVVAVVGDHDAERDRGQRRPDHRQRRDHRHRARLRRPEPGQRLPVRRVHDLRGPVRRGRRDRPRRGQSAPSRPSASASPGSATSTAPSGTSATARSPASAT